MVSNPVVTVLIASYNYDRFIAQALHSVLAQTYPTDCVETLVVDDGSTDNTEAVVRSFGSKVRYLPQVHQGQGQAFNTGLQEAKGQYILFLDADDVWHPFKITRVVAAFLAHPEVGLVQHRMRDTPSARVRGSFNLPAERAFKQTPNDFLSGRIQFTGTSGLSFQREILKTLPAVPRELFFCADEYLYTHAALIAPVWTIDMPLGERRLHSGNWYAGELGKERLKNLLEVRKILDERLDRTLIERGQTQTDAAKQRHRLDVLRDEILLLSLEGKKEDARRRLDEAFKSFPKNGFFRFKQATLAIAAYSPKLYLGLMEKLYGRLGWIRWLREKILPAS